MSVIHCSMVIFRSVHGGRKETTHSLRVSEASLDKRCLLCRRGASGASEALIISAYTLLSWCRSRFMGD
jgi:hypothetical protein